LSQRERTYYQDERAHVTFKRAIIDGESYDIADMTAVRMQIEQPDILRPVLILSFGFLLVIVGLLTDLGTFSVVLIGLGVISAAAGTLVILLSKVRYVVVIDGAEGEVQALTSRDKAVVSPIVDAIGEVLIVQEH
jgi:hypothetical protein